MTTHVTRRQLLTLLAAAIALPHQACKPKDDVGDGTDESDDTEGTTAVDRHPFEVVEELRAALRTSSEHLPAEAQRLIDGADAAAIFAFVRDQIQVFPASLGSFGPADRRIAGPRGTLRGGAGTLRDKADLLAWMFVEAGFSASVVSGVPTLSGSTLKEALLRRPTRSVDPEITADQLSAWRTELGLPAEPAPLPPYDDEGSASAALGELLLASLPQGFVPGTAAFDFSLGDWPIVEVTLDGTPTYANPHVPGADLGEAFTEVIFAAGEAVEYGDVVVEVAIETTADAFVKPVVVSGTFKSSELIGRQLRLAFVPALPAELLIGAPVSQVTTFVPTLVLEGTDLDRVAQAKVAITGQAFSVGGEVYEMDGSDVLIDGIPIDAGTTDPSVLAGITGISVTAGAAAFPSVELRVAVKGSAGPVEGLHADVFGITDAGDGVAATLLRDKPPAPRVLFVFDQSRSVPAEFVGASAAALAQEIAEAVLVEFPGAEFKARAVEFGLLGDGDWTSSPEELSAMTLSLIGAGSELWMALGAAAAEEPAIVVLITDGVSTDTPETGLVAAVQKGLPVLVFGVGEADAATLDLIATLSKGEALEISAPAEAVEPIVAALKASVETAYVLRYRALSDSPATREVVVQIGAVTGTAEYEVPAQPLPAKRLAAVWLYVSSGEREARRRIIGVDKPGPVDLDDAHLGLLGTWILSAEYGPLGPTQILDDLATERLSKRPLYDAFAEGSTPGPWARFQEGSVQVPSEALFVAVPLPEHGHPERLTWPAGPRLALWSHRPETGAIVRQLDLLGTHHLRTAHEDPQVAFETTLKRSLRLSLGEAAMYPDAAANQLDGADLVWIRPFVDLPESWSLETKARWGSRLETLIGKWLGVPADGSGDVCWALDVESGTILGILGDGSGGGQKKDPAEVYLTKGLFDLIAILAQALGAGTGLGLLISIHKGLTVLVVKATLAILSMESWTDSIDPDEVIRGFLCDFVKGIGGGLPAEDTWAQSAAELFSFADSGIEIIRGEDIPCPFISK